MRAVGSMVVYGCLHASMIQRLYVPSPAEWRIDAVLRGPDAGAASGDDGGGGLRVVLQPLLELLEDELRDTVLAEVRVSTLQAFERVLFDGGPQRLFTTADAAIFKDDYMAIVAYFTELRMSLRGSRFDIRHLDFDQCRCARCSEKFATVFCKDCEEGLFCSSCSKEMHQGKWSKHELVDFIDRKSQDHMHKLMPLFTTSSAQLVGRLRALKDQVGSQIAAAAAQSGVDAGFTTTNIVRVLAHRDDDEALKFLRKEFQGKFESGGVRIDITSDNPFGATGVSGTSAAKSNFRDLVGSVKAASSFMRKDKLRS